MTPAPKRRWFAYSLRTLFVVVTMAALLSCWVAYQLNWIQQRHAVIDSGKVAAGDGPYHRPGIEPSAPGLLWIFGEGAYEYIVVFADRQAETLSRAEQAEVDHVARLFPEARVEPHWTKAHHTNCPRPPATNSH